MNVRFLPEARAELTEAVLRYDSQRDGLGDAFTDEVQSAIARIELLPEAWTPLAAGIRRCRTNHFPYGLVYSIEGEELVIIAVMHLHRRPGYWKDRL